jgi:hypothetical protein
MQPATKLAVHGGWGSLEHHLVVVDEIHMSTHKIVMQQKKTLVNGNCPQLEKWTLVPGRNSRLVPVGRPVPLDRY